MRVLVRIGLCCLVSGSMMAQSRGGVGSGGIRAGGGRGVGGTPIGRMPGGLRGGNPGGGFRGSLGGFRFSDGLRGRSFGGYRAGYTGLGYGYWPASYYPFGLFDWDYGDFSPYISTAPSYPVYEYNTSPNVTVLYPAQESTPGESVQVQPVLRSYDQYGQEVLPGTAAAPSGSGSPIYLIAMKDQVIRAASSYWVEGRTLHYITLQREEKQTPLDTVDRGMTLQLNRERRVSISLPE